MTCLTQHNDHRSGRMRSNYGICLFWFDRLFGTFRAEHRKFNHLGLAMAMRRYAFIFPKKPR